VLLLPNELAVSRAAASRTVTSLAESSDSSVSNKRGRKHASDRALWRDAATAVAEMPRCLNSAHLGERRRWFQYGVPINSPIFSSSASVAWSCAGAEDMKSRLCSSLAAHSSLGLRLLECGPRHDHRWTEPFEKHVPSRRQEFLRKCYAIKTLVHQLSLGPNVASAVRRVGFRAGRFKVVSVRTAWRFVMVIVLAALWLWLLMTALACASAESHPSRWWA
jgi:hypothetical protein